MVWALAGDSTMTSALPSFGGLAGRSAAATGLVTTAFSLVLAAGVVAAGVFVAEVFAAGLALAFALATVALATVASFSPAGLAAFLLGTGHLVLPTGCAANEPLDLGHRQHAQHPPDGFAQPPGQPLGGVGFLYDRGYHG